MVVFLWSLIVSGTAFLIHLLIWKIRIPKRQTKVLLTVFFATLFVFVGTFIILADFFHNSMAVMPNTFPQYLHICLFVISVTLAYMITYSALEADSPSLVMVMEIDKAGREGLPVDSFKKAMTDEVLVIPRAKDLLRDKLAFLDENKRYRLTNKGKLFVCIFSYYRRLLNIDKKGG